MTAIKRILVATDFSEQADAALDLAHQLALKFGASIDLVHVFEEPWLATAVGVDGYVSPTPNVREELRTDAVTQLNGQLPKATADGVPAGTELLTGPTAKAIVEHAASQHADLIVMGTHGRGGVAHLLLGSIAERVLRTAPCPVLTVRHARAATPYTAAA